ncbi:MAG: adenylate kinase [Clostridia bacterium]|nr:adenylate kinase [Clostridia bacterium]
MIIIMLGAPASGKGSVAGVLSERYNIPSISTGDIFRKNISEGTELGILANTYMTKGELVPDDVTVDMIVSRLEDPDVENGLILDGFPRTVYQAEKLDEILEEKGKKIDVVVNLESVEEELLTRIVNRRVCSNCKATYNTVLQPPAIDGICDKCGGELIQRDDDTLEKAVNRIQVYKTQTAPVADYYEKTGVLFTTLLSERANRMKNEVANDVVEYLNNK